MSQFDWPMIFPVISESVALTGGLYSKAVLTAEYHPNICVSPNINILLIPTINIASGCQETICRSADGKHNYDSQDHT